MNVRGINNIIKNDLKQQFSDIIQGNTLNKATNIETNNAAAKSNEMKISAPRNINIPNNTIAKI